MTTHDGKAGFVEALRGRWRRVSPGTRDALLAGFLTVITQIEVLTAPSVEGSLAVQSASFAVMTISVAFRRTNPLLAAGLVAGGLAVQTLAGEAEITGGFIALLIVMYSVASYADRTVALVGGAMILGSVLIYPIVEDVNFGNEVSNAVIFIGPWVLGRLIRDREIRAIDAEAEAVRVASDRDEQVQRAVLEERGRIARDMHDIVAHGVSMMVLQSGAARQSMQTDLPSAEELLLNVESSGRQALDEMHLLLEVLKAPSSSDSNATTNLTIATINDLAQQTSGTATSTHFTIDGARRPLPPSLEISVYRIAQEALTNAIKHGSPSRVDIAVAYEMNAVTLRVTDNGGHPTKPALSGTGNGLIGMRERAELFGGTVTAGPRSPEPGWQVAAELPVPPPA